MEHNLENELEVLEIKLDSSPDKRSSLGRDELNKKYHTLGASVDDKTYRRIAQAAKKSGMSISKYCRQRIIQNEQILPSEQLNNVEILLKELDELFRESITHLRNLGGNINQAQHRFNELVMTGTISGDVETKITKLGKLNTFNVKAFDDRIKDYIYWSDRDYAKHRDDFEKLKEEYSAGLFIISQLAERVKSVS